MKQLFWHRLDHIARALFPVFFTLFLAILSAVPLRIPGLSAIMPAMTVVAVYYWVVHRPQLLPIWAIGLIGLVQDLLGGGPPGVSILTLFSVFLVVAWQRKIFTSASFALVWTIFMAVAAVALAVAWALTCLALWAYFDPRPVLFQYLMTIAVYPLFAWTMIQGQRFFEA